MRPIDGTAKSTGYGLHFSEYEVAHRLRRQLARDTMRRISARRNRRYLEDALAREIGRARRHASPLSVILIDVDHFKRFNDTNGHEGGDVLLAEFDQTLARFVRGEDIACRFGGEEFAVILLGTDLNVAAQRAEDLRAVVKRMTIRLRRQTLASVTASFGAATLHEHDKTGPDVMKAADDALYEAKDGTRSHRGRSPLHRAGSAGGSQRQLTVQFDDAIDQRKNRLERAS